TVGGTFTTARDMASASYQAVLQARRERHHDVRGAGPERAVGELRYRRHGLRVGEAHAGGEARAPGTRSEESAHHVRLGVLLGDDVYRLHVVGSRHGAFDGDGERDGVAVVDQRRQVQLHATVAYRRAANQLAHRLLHLGRRRLRVVRHARE